MSAVGDKLRATSINQTGFLFGALAFGFLFFVTARGDLPKWLGLLGLGGGSAAQPTAAPTAAPSTAPLTYPGQSPDAPAGAIAPNGLPRLPSIPSQPGFTPWDSAG